MFTEKYLSQNIQYERSTHSKLDKFRAMLLKNTLQSYRRKSHILTIYLTSAFFICFALMTFSAGLLDQPSVLEFGLRQYKKPGVFYHVEGNFSKPSLMEYVSFQYRLLCKQENDLTQFYVVQPLTSVNDDVLSTRHHQLPLIKKELVAGASFKDDEIIAWLNNEILHAAPITMNLVHNALIRFLLFFFFTVFCGIVFIT